MHPYYVDAEGVLEQLERERNAHMREGRRLRALAEPRGVSAHRPVDIASLRGFLSRLRWALAAPMRPNVVLRAEEVS